MLYDPKWEQNTRPAEPSLEGLVEWLEQQHPDREYEFKDPLRCVWGQYYRSRGWEPFDCFNGMGMSWKVAKTEPHTFGAALERARVALTKGQRE